MFYSFVSWWDNVLDGHLFSYVDLNLLRLREGKEGELSIGELSLLGR